MKRVSKMPWPNTSKYLYRFEGINIPNGCWDAYEVKSNIDIFKYQEKVKLISQFFYIFLMALRVYFTPIK